MNEEVHYGGSDQVSDGDSNRVNNSNSYGSLMVTVMG